MSEGQALGLDSASVEYVLLGGLAEKDEAWVSSSERGRERPAQEVARGDLRVGISGVADRVEYHCRQHDGSAQGTAVAGRLRTGACCW